MINTEDVKYPPSSIDDIKDIKLKVDLSYDAGLFFHNQIKFYWKKEGCYNDDGTISKFRLNENHYTSDVIIKKLTNDKTLILYHKELKTNLPVLYLDV